MPDFALSVSVSFHTQSDHTVRVLARSLLRARGGAMNNMPGQRGPAGTAPSDPVATGPPLNLCCRGS